MHVQAFVSRSARKFNNERETKMSDSNNNNNISSSNSGSPSSANEVSHYVVTAHPSGAVLQTAKCNFMSPHSLVRRARAKSTQ